MTSTFSDQKALQSGIQTESGKLISTTTNLLTTTTELKWQQGEKIALSFDMTMRSCGAMCQFCYAMVQEPQKSNYYQDSLTIGRF